MLLLSSLFPIPYMLYKETLVSFLGDHFLPLYGIWAGRTPFWPPGIFKKHPNVHYWTLFWPSLHHLPILYRFSVNLWQILDHFLSIFDHFGIIFGALFCGLISPHFPTDFRSRNLQFSISVSWRIIQKPMKNIGFLRFSNITRYGRAHHFEHPSF